jgi:hypothetical protein
VRRLFAIAFVAGLAALGAVLFLRGMKAGSRSAAGGPDAHDRAAPASAFDAAVANARALNLPLLVLIRPVQEACPPVGRLRNVLAASPEVGRCCVPIEACGGPGTGAAEVRVVTRARRGRTIPPLLAVVTADLHVLHVQAAHLMCFYGGAGHVAPLDEAAECGLLWGGPEMALLVKRTLARKADVEQALAALPESDSPGHRVDRAELLAEIGRIEEAVPLALAAAQARLGMEQARRVLAVLLRADDESHARRFVDDVLATRGAEPGAGWLLLDAHALRAPTSAEDLASAAERAHAGGEWHLEFRLKAARLRALAARLPNTGLPREVRALHEAAVGVFDGHPVEGARFLDDLARAAAGARDVELAERLIRQLNREYPETDEAVIYRHAQLDRLREGLELRVPPRRSTSAPSSTKAPAVPR